MSMRRHTVLTALAVTALATCGLATAGASAATAAPLAADPQRVRVVTVNVDFGAPPETVRSDFERYSRHADVIMLQEARDVWLRNLVDTDTWIVRQDTSSESTRGSALAIRRDAVRATNGVTDFRLVKGTDGGPCPDGGIQTRWIAVADVHLRNGATLVAASLHMPPPRCATGPGSLYAVMADNVVALSNRHPSRLLLGGDWNKTVSEDPNDISGRSDGRIVPRGIGIDGFYKPKALTNEPLTSLGDIFGHHEPIQMAVSVPASF